MESRFPRRWPLLSVGTLNLDPVALFCSLCHVYYIGCFVEIRVTEVLRIHTYSDSTIEGDWAGTNSDSLQLQRCSPVADIGRSIWSD